MKRPAQRRGRWYVFRDPRPYNPACPWRILLWGGNGEHWADGAELETWATAMLLVNQAARTPRALIEGRYLA